MRESTFTLSTLVCTWLLTKYSFHMFFNQIDRFKQNHFLWVTAGGMAVAQISGRNEAEAVDKQLGDEDEDPENGEG